MHNTVKLFGCSVDELKQKEVISVCDGRRMGYICDLTIDICDGRILSIIVPGSNKFFSFKKPDMINIPWCNIEKIGDDTILVRPGPPEPRRNKE